MKAEMTANTMHNLSSARENYYQAMATAAQLGVPDPRDLGFAQFSSPFVGRRFLIDAECGVGKLTALAQKLKEHSSLRASIIVADHQITGNLDKCFGELLGEEFAVIRGMTADNPNGSAKMCLVPDLVDKVREIGGRWKDLCGKLGDDKYCPHRETCAYHQQNFGARVTMMAGGVSLGLLDGLEELPDVIVIDDVPVNRLMNSTSVELKELMNFVQMTKPEEARVSEAARGLMNEFCIDMLKVVGSKESGAMLGLSDFSDMAASDMMEVVNASRQSMVDLKPIIDPSKPRPGVIACEKQFARWNQRCGGLKRLSDAVGRLLDGRQASIQVLRTSEDCVTLVVYIPQTPPHSCRNVPIAVLDATGNKDLLEMFFQSDVRHDPSPRVRDFVGVQHIKVCDSVMGFRSWSPAKCERYKCAPRAIHKGPTDRREQHPVARDVPRQARV